MTAAPRWPDDRRTVKGYRVTFDRETERDAWYTAQLLKRLRPAGRWRVRAFAEACFTTSSEMETLAAAGDAQAITELAEDQRLDEARLTSRERLNRTRGK